MRKGTTSDGLSAMKPREPSFCVTSKVKKALTSEKNAQEYAGWGDRELAGFSGKGIWVDSETETEIRNLFAGGDEVGGFPFQSAPGAIAMGWYAGNMAAKRAREEKSLLPVGDNDAVKSSQTTLP